MFLLLMVIIRPLDAHSLSWRKRSEISEHFTRFDAKLLSDMWNFLLSYSISLFSGIVSRANNGLIHHQRNDVYLRSSSRKKRKNEFNDVNDTKLKFFCNEFSHRCISSNADSFNFNRIKNLKSRWRCDETVKQKIRSNQRKTARGENFPVDFC